MNLPHARVARLGLLLAMLLSLAACTRGGSEAAPTQDPNTVIFATFTPDALPTVQTDLPPGEATLPPAATIPPEEGQQPPPAPAATRLSLLRFGATGNGPEMSAFPLNSEEVCAIFDYRDMTAADVIRRVWLLNDQLYVERQEPWPMDKYGASGTARDVCLFDRIDGFIDGSVDGIDPGRWRVELYLNGNAEQSAEFTVGQ